MVSHSWSKVCARPRLLVGAAVKLYLAIKVRDTSGNRAILEEVFFTIALKMRWLLSYLIVLSRSPVPTMWPTRVWFEISSLSYLTISAPFDYSESRISNQRVATFEAGLLASKWDRVSARIVVCLCVITQLLASLLQEIWASYPFGWNCFTTSTFVPFK